VFLLIALSVFSVGISFVNTFMPALVSTNTPDESKGVVMGVYESIGSMSRIIGPLIAYSIAITYIRIEYAFFGMLMLLLIPIMYYFFIYRK